MKRVVLLASIRFMLKNVVKLEYPSFVTLTIEYVTINTNQESEINGKCGELNDIEKEICSKNKLQW